MTNETVWERPGGANGAAADAAGGTIAVIPRPGQGDAPEAMGAARVRAQRAAEERVQQAALAVAAARDAEGAVSRPFGDVGGTVCVADRRRGGEANSWVSP